MHNCYYCSKSYTWPDSLKRHIRQTHNTHELDTSEAKRLNISDEMECDQHACLKCGAVFDSKTSMQNHMALCNIDESDSDISSVNSDDIEDESVWIDLVHEVYNLHDEQFQEKINNHTATGEDDPHQAAADEMQPVYKRTLKKLLQQKLLFAMQIKKSEHHEKLMEDIKFYSDVKNYELSKAVNFAIRRNNDMLDDILEDVGSNDEHSDSETDVSDESQMVDEQ